MEAIRRAMALFGRHRRRLAPLVLGIGLALVGAEVFGAFPRETSVQFGLGEENRDVFEARVAYSLDGEEVKGARFQWDDRAPSSFRHSVELSPGRYEVRVELVSESGRRTLRRSLVVPADGVVSIELGGQAAATKFPQTLPGLLIPRRHV